VHRLVDPVAAIAEYGVAEQVAALAALVAELTQASLGDAGSACADFQFHLLGLDACADFDGPGDLL
jgi:hypothetical protein